MEGDDISIAAISARKIQEIAAKTDVTIFKKALNQQREIASTLIEGATQAPLPPGVGTKVNTVA